MPTTCFAPFSNATVLLVYANVHSRVVTIDTLGGICIFGVTQDVQISQQVYRKLQSETPFKNSQYPKFGLFE